MSLLQLYMRGPFESVAKFAIYQYIFLYYNVHAILYLLWTQCVHIFNCLRSPTDLVDLQIFRQDVDGHVELMATGSSKRAMTFSAGGYVVAWGLDLGGKMSPLKCLAKILTTISRIYLLYRKWELIRIHHPNSYGVTANVLVDEIHPTDNWEWAHVHFNGVAVVDSDYLDVFARRRPTALAAAVDARQNPPWWQQTGSGFPQRFPVSRTWFFGYCLMSEVGVVGSDRLAHQSPPRKTTSGLLPPR